jgi:hypothetical protein
MPVESNPCSNCSNPVASRRRSKSGMHFCTRPACQAAKQRFYRHRREETAEEDARSEQLQLVESLVSSVRIECHGCGLENALPGWAHRDATDPVKPCTAVGNKGRKLGPGFIDTIWPELVPS